MFRSMIRRIEGGTYYLEHFVVKRAFYGIEIKKVLYDAKSKYQRITVLDTYSFGRVLVLDGSIQLTSSDEQLFHSSLVDPAMKSLKPRKVLILGGGDLMAAREVLKYDFVEKVDLVELDEKVLEVSKKFFKKKIKNVEKDERLNIIIGDALKQVAKTKEKFDLIISDLTDWKVGEERGKQVNRLYGVKFIKLLKSKLSRTGGLVYQSGGGLMFDKKNLEVIFRKFQRVFSTVVSYFTFIPSFLDAWVFFYATDLKKRPVLENDLSNLYQVEVKF